MAPLRPPLRPPAKSVPAKPATEPPFVASRREFDECERDVTIDKDDLDNEFIHQPELYKRVIKQSELAISYRDEAERTRDKVLAARELYIRDLHKPAPATDAKRADEKKSEGHIKALVAADPEVQKAEDAYTQWVTLSRQWTGLLRYYDAREKALEYLTRLWLGGYWTTSAGKGVVGPSERSAQAVREELAKQRGPR